MRLRHIFFLTRICLDNNRSFVGGAGTHANLTFLFIAFIVKERISSLEQTSVNRKWVEQRENVEGRREGVKVQRWFDDGEKWKGEEV